MEREKRNVVKYGNNFMFLPLNCTFSKADLKAPQIPKNKYLFIHKTSFNNVFLNI